MSYPLSTPCGWCRHILERHQAQEGMCFDCDCIGWWPPDEEETT